MIIFLSFCYPVCHTYIESKRERKQTKGKQKNKKKTGKDPAGKKGKRTMKKDFYRIDVYNEYGNLCERYGSHDIDKLSKKIKKESHDSEGNIYGLYYFGHKKYYINGKKVSEDTFYKNYRF